MAYLSRINKMDQSDNIDCLVTYINSSIPADLDKCKYYLDRGDNIEDYIYIPTQTSLFFADKHNDYDAIEFLIKHGAKGDSNLITKRKRAQLFDYLGSYQCNNPDFDKCEKLLSLGADINFYSNRQDQTALFYAAQQGNIDLVIWLVKNGTKLRPNYGNPNETSPYDAADYAQYFYSNNKGHSQVLTFLEEEHQRQNIPIQVQPDNRETVLSLRGPAFP